MSELHNYSIDTQRAIEQMLDMNKRATKSCINTENQSTHTPAQHTHQKNASQFMNFPFDSDSITILALMLILYNNSNDMLLILALVYILI